MDAAQKQQQHGDTAIPYSGFSPARWRFIIGLVSTAGFLGPLAGGIYLPALPVLEQEFGVSYTAINATVSVFMALCAFTPLFWSAFADWKGRRPLYVISLAIYLVANVLMASLPANFGALVFLRMVQAFGWPTLGPVLGGVITGQASWRWTFGVLSIVVGVTWLVIVFTLPETLRCRVGNGSLYCNDGLFLLPPRLASPLAPESERGPRPPKPSIGGFWRLFCYPPISISSVYTAILFANYFSVAVDLPLTLTDKYHWSVTAVGGGYLALGIAIVAGSLLAGRFSDWRRARTAKVSADGHVAPESRLVDQIWGTIACAAGSIMYGWFVDRSIHPAALLVATFLNGFGMSSVLVVTFAFLTECAPQATAGAMALENMLRNPAAAISAVVLSPLVARMGAGWFFTGFALLDLLSVGSGALALSLYGPRWRAKSPIPGPPPNSGTSSATEKKNAGEV
ncbi:hypothetical protein DL765_007060 [Monosporascus sp. GIB2]|nr:hypothetical protein DL765_007060 [Monosporascus sp. GIB2]